MATPPDPNKAKELARTRAVLDLTISGELIEALERRSDASVVVLLRKQGADDECVQSSYRGGSYQALGLLKGLERKILKLLDQNEDMKDGEGI